MTVPDFSPPSAPSRFALTEEEIHLIKRITLWTVAFCSTFFLMAVAFAASGELQHLALQVASGFAAPLAPHDADGRTNLLLLGVGDRDHAGADLTDTIIVASIEPRTQSLVLLSIPRDLFITGEGVRQGKINALYADYKRRNRRDGMSASGSSIAALRSVSDAVGTRLGIELHGVIKLNFTGFTQIVDTFGGVEIDVPRAIVDATYPIREGVTGFLTIPAGPQHFDGAMALRYARSRHGSTDFDRSGRQQQILNALMETARRRPLLGDPTVTAPILETLRTQAEWTLTLPELFGVAASVLESDLSRIIRMQLNTRTGSDGSQAAAGGFIISASALGGSATGSDLLPVSLAGEQDDWGQLRTLTAMLLLHRDVYLERPVIEVMPAVGAALTAHHLRNELRRYGFMVAETEAAADATGESSATGGALVTDGSSVTALTDGSAASAQVFAELLGFPLHIAETPIAGSGATIRITIGVGERFTPFQTRMISPTESL